MSDLIARTVTADALDLVEVLDRVYELSMVNFRPWWACAEPPYPSRPELDRMMVQQTPRLALVTVADEDGLRGYDFHSPEGVLLAGFVRHNPTHRGFTSAYDEWALEAQRAMNDQVRANTGGTIYHVTFANQSIWYALEVVCGIPRAPLPWPQNTSPAPTGWAAYTGPPPPAV